jgi:hypothetical protein
MVTKVPSPFASPFAKILLTIVWIAYTGMLVAFVVGRDVNLLIIVVAWTFILPWITWNFLSGVQVEAGSRVGGGAFMYQRVALEAGEVVLFAAPALIGRSMGHVFVTDRRVITLPIRSFTRPPATTTTLASLKASELASKGAGWLQPRRRLELTAEGTALTLRPWTGQGLGFGLDSFMGTISADAFFTGLSDALRSAGVLVSTNG